MKTIIYTCDKYRNILEANKYTMNKYGGSNLDITVIGYKKPEFDMGSWEFISLGEDIGPKNFTNDIWKYFKDFNDEYFIYGNDDCIFTNEMNLNFLNEILDTIDKIPNFGRMWLTQTPPAFYGGSLKIKEYNNYSIEEIMPNADYRLSLQYSIWKTTYFKKYLIPNISPWEWESRDSAKNDGASILLPVNNFVISVGHVMKKGKLLNNWHNSIYNDGRLNDYDIKYVENIFKKHNIL